MDKLFREDEDDLGESFVVEVDEETALLGGTQRVVARRESIGIPV